MRKTTTDYIGKKTALGVGKARQRNTKPIKRLAHKVERREAKQETLYQEPEEDCQHEFGLAGLGDCWRCKKCGKWE